MPLFFTWFIPLRRWTFNFRRCNRRLPKHTSWPEGDTPTRTSVFPPQGSVMGTEVTDTIDPIEDVYYRIEPGWNVNANVIGDSDSVRIVPVSGYMQRLAINNNSCDGLRIRISDPSTMNPVTIRFTVTRIQGPERTSPSFMPQAQTTVRQNPNTPPTYYPSSYLQSSQQHRQVPNSQPTYYPSSRPQSSHKP